MSQAGSFIACLTDLTLPVNSLETISANGDASCFIVYSRVEIIAENICLLGHCDGGEMIQSAKDEVNIAKEPGLWFDFSVDDVVYWTACGASDCQLHNRPFNKPYRHGKPVRYYSQKFWLGQKPKVRNTRGGYCIHSTGSVYFCL